MTNIAGRAQQKSVDEDVNNETILATLSFITIEHFHIYCCLTICSNLFLISSKLIFVPLENAIRTLPTSKSTSTFLTFALFINVFSIPRAQKSHTIPFTFTTAICSPLARSFVNLVYFWYQFQTLRRKQISWVDYQTRDHDSYERNQLML